MKICSTVVIVVLSPGVACLGAEPMAKELDDAKKSFAAAADSEVAGRAIQRVLKVAGSDLKPLLADENTGIALRAAWEIAQRRAKSGDESAWPWFVGFLQGRTKLQIPLRWEFNLAWRFFDPSRTKQGELILRSYMKKTDELYDHDGLPRWKRPAQPKGDAAEWRRDRSKRKADPGELALTTAAGHTLRISAVASKKVWSKSRFDAVSALAVGQLTYAAFPTDMGEGFPVVCMRRESSEIVWEAKSWGSGEVIGQFTGPTGHEMSLDQRGDIIAVFGSSVMGSYLEVFDSKSGKLVFRFCPSDWNAWREETGH
jgi:hypothetical protein